MTHRVIKSATVQNETEKAIQILFNGMKAWLPKKIISSIYTNENDTKDYIIPMWFAKKLGI